MKRSNRKLTSKLPLLVLLTTIMTITLFADIPIKDMSEVEAATTLLNPRKNDNGFVTYDCVWFGRYPQSDATGKTKDPIKWRVLSVDGNDAFLVADQNLDVQRYNDTWVDVTWETCTIRSWLNGYGSSSNVCGTDYNNDNFIDCAFIGAEQNAILTTTIVNRNNSKYGTEGGNNTQDKVFLLSYNEVSNSAYGFSSDYSDFDGARQHSNTAYVAAGGALGETIGSSYMYSEGINDWWLLRSPGFTSNYALVIDRDGYFDEDGGNVSDAFAVCPALHLDLLSTDSWSYAGTVSSDGSSTEGKEPPVQKEIDTDGDGLLDIWEKEGVDTNGDGKIDLHIEKMGADPNIPDIFVEVDWMVQPQKKILWVTTQEELSLAPSENAMRIVYQAFKNHGINIHIDAGPSSTDFVTGKTWGDLSGGNVIAYEKNFSLGNDFEHWSSVVDNNFSQNRKSVFRHAMFINTYDGGTSSGIANDIPGQFFIVANQEWLRNTGDIGVAGTFMHELGHTLGFSHGGFDNREENDYTQYKPNYLSIMNYLFQTTGLLGTGSVNYSDYDLPEINENAIYEKDGIDPERLTMGTGLGTKLLKSGTIYNNIAGSSIDFNGSGIIDSDSISLDLNNDDKKTILYGLNDWKKIKYTGGNLGRGSQHLQTSGFAKPIEDGYDFVELTIEEALENGVVSTIGTGALEAVGPFTLVSDEVEQKVYIRVTNMGNEDTSFTLKIENSNICDGFTKQITIAGSKEDLQSVDVAVPIVNGIPDGEYSIRAWLSHPDKEDISIDVPLSIYTPTTKEIQDLKDEIKKDSLNDLPEIVVSEYNDIIGQIIGYSISYDLAGGVDGGNPTSYTKDTETFTLKNPTRLGYTFTGWTGSNGNTPQKEVTISKGTIGDLSYVANWEQDSSSDNGNDEDTQPGNLSGDEGSTGNTGNSTEGNTENLDGNTDVKATGLKLTGMSKKIAAGKKITLTPVFTPTSVTNKKLKWTSSNKKYATVNGKGVVTTKKKGAGKFVKIIATAQDGSNKKATYKITIMKHAVKSIKLTAKSNTVKARKKLTVKATVKTTGKKVNKTLQWTSSNTKYATVTKKGVVKTKKAGKGKTVKITAKATDGTNKKATFKIKIK